VNFERLFSYKIEPDTRVTWSQARTCFALTVWNQVMYVLPISVFQCVWTSNIVLPLRAPTLFEFVWQQYVALMIFDFLFYVWHVIHHRVPFLYRWILEEQFFLCSVNEFFSWDCSENGSSWKQEISRGPAHALIRFVTSNIRFLFAENQH
jgi:hypothetical protein